MQKLKMSCLSRRMEHRWGYVSRFSELNNRLYLELGLLVFAFWGLCFAIGVVLTHRVVGPLFAAKRHIDLLNEGKFEVRTHLRPGDELEDLISNLNRLSKC